MAREAPQSLYALPLRDLHGVPHTLEEWRGRPLLVNFWASWCAPCREEMPVLSQLALAQRGKVEVVGLALDTPEAISDYLRSTPVAYPVFVPADSVKALELLAKLGNPTRGLPFSVFLAADGRIRWVKLGVINAEQNLLSP